MKRFWFKGDAYFLDDIHPVAADRAVAVFIGTHTFYKEYCKWEFRMKRGIWEPEKYMHFTPVKDGILEAYFRSMKEEKTT